MEKKHSGKVSCIKYMWPSITCTVICGIGLFLIIIAAHLSSELSPVDIRELKLMDSIHIAGQIIFWLSILDFYAATKVLKFKQANEGVVVSKKQHIIVDE